MHAPQPFSTWRSSDNTSADDLKGHDIALSRGPSKLLTLRQIEIHEFSCVEPFRLISESLLVAAFGGGWIDLLKNFLVHPSLYCSAFSA
tara:strand:- start:184 stop:450 length:267 start_codon:yes stop_codon:yes gene_type:complete